MSSSGIAAVAGVYRQQTGVAPEGPVFRPLAASVGALSKTTVGQRLKKGLQAVGVRNWDLYAAHSLRRGGATWAVQ